MNPQQQQAALADAMLHLASFAEKINSKERRKWATHGPCETVLVGGKDGAHKLCNITMGGDRCNFISFGISTDYSFDVDLAEKWHCRGFAADPTIVHQSQFHPLVTFHNIAAKMLNPNEEAMSDGSSSNWWVTSMPALSKFLGIERVNILKLDCEGKVQACWYCSCCCCCCCYSLLSLAHMEVSLGLCYLPWDHRCSIIATKGCEYSLARDILAEDPTFLHRVDQFSFEAHVSKQWLDSAEALYTKIGDAWMRWSRWDYPVVRRVIGGVGPVAMTTCLPDFKN
jgi:hypothetical protein